MNIYRYEIWSTNPGENPEESPDWNPDLPFEPGKITDQWNISFFEVFADNDCDAIFKARGSAFCEGWSKDGTRDRMFSFQPAVDPEGYPWGSYAKS